MNKLSEFQPKIFLIQSANTGKSYEYVIERIEQY